MKAAAVWFWWIWGTRLLLAALFFYAGVLKLGTSERFAVTVAQFTFLPAALIGPFTLGLALTETLAAILLVVPRTARLGAGLVAALLVAFIAALIWALRQGLVMDCGCFGAFGEDPEPSREKMILALARDVALLALTLGLAFRRP